MKRLLTLLAIASFATLPALAANTPPPGNNGDVMTNKNGQWGATPLRPGSLLGEVTTGNPTAVTVGNGLNLTASGVLTTTTSASSALGSATTANPAINGDPTSGFYTAGPGKVDAQALGTKAMEWTSTSVNVPSLPAYSLTGTSTGGTLTNVLVGTNLTLTTTGGVTTLNAGGIAPTELDIIEENGPIIIEENGPNIVEENSP